MPDRHRAYFGELAQRADRELWALVPAGRARLDDESPNLRAAIDDGCARAPDDALATVGALGLYWRVRGRLAEGVTAMEQSLRAAPPEPSPGRALALAKLSLLSFWLGDFVRTQSAATSALEMGAAMLPVALAFAATADPPAAVLTGPVATAHVPPGVIRLPRPAGTGDRVRVSIAGQPLTATAALVWNGDLPRPLQQNLFDTADAATPPAPASLSRAG